MNILEIKLKENDANAETIGYYLKALLIKLWKDEESFSGKRPFGNSGWKYIVYESLIENNIINGEIDEDGFISYLSDDERKKGDKLIFDAIENMKVSC